MQSDMGNVAASQHDDSESRRDESEEHKVQWGELDDVNDVPSDTEGSLGDDKAKILDQLLDVEESARKKYDEGVRTTNPSAALKRLNDALADKPNTVSIPAPVPMFAPSAESTTLLDLARRLSALEKKATASATAAVEQRASSELKIADLSAQVAALKSENERLRHLVGKFENEALKRLRSLDDEFVTIVSAAAKHVSTLEAPPAGLEPDKLQSVASVVSTAAAATVTRPTGVSPTTGIYKKKKFVGQRA